MFTDLKANCQIKGGFQIIFSDVEFFDRQGTLDDNNRGLHPSIRDQIHCNPAVEMPLIMHEFHNRHR